MIVFLFLPTKKILEKTCFFLAFTVVLPPNRKILYRLFGEIYDHYQKPILNFFTFRTKSFKNTKNALIFKILVGCGC